MNPQVEVVGRGHYVHVPAVGWMMRDLGIRKPVRIMWGEDSDFRAPEVVGYHAEENGIHYIMLRPGRSKIESSRTLCHELVHCAQSERYADWPDRYQRERTKGYFYDNRFESEARVMEDTLASKYVPVR